MKNFKELIIWQRGIEIVKKVYDLTKQFPSQEKFGIISQMTRAAVSISANIAEGSSRTSSKDYNRFLEMSLGSSFEMETQLMIAEAVNFGVKEKRDDLLKEIDEEQKMLMSFMSKLH